MAESRHEQIILALKAALEGIVADGGVSYWYSPDAVLRWPVCDASCQDSSLDTIFVLSPSDVDDEQADSCSARALLRLDLTALHKFEGIENPFQQEAPIRETVQNRLERDVKKLLRTDTTLGGLALDVRIPVTSYGPETYWQGWAGVILRLEIKYHYPKVLP